MENYQNKNIWILNHYAKTPDMPGGTRHYDFGKELAKRGYKVTIFASSFHHNQHKELKLTKNEKYKIENIDGINFVWIKTFSYRKNDWRRMINMISYMWRVYWLGKKITKIDKNIGKPDIIIGSSVHLLAALAAYWLSKYYKAKFIMEVRDLWPQVLIDMRRFKENNPIIKILQILEKFLYKKAKKIIVLLPRAEEYITLLGIEKVKIRWIPNGVDISRFPEIHNKKGDDSIFKVIYFGAHGIANALEYILMAAKIIQNKNYKDIIFSLYGNGTEKKRLIEYKEKIGLKNLEFHSPIPKSEVYKVISNADVLLCTYKYHDTLRYGTSLNKLYDCMALAKPIIYTSKEKNNIVNISKCGITIPFENAQAMANAILTLYQKSSAERKEMGKRGREYVEKYHSIPVLVDKLEKVFQEVIK